MAAEVKYDKSHHAGATPEARIANRLRNSGGDGADHIAKHGDGPTRAITNLHNAGHVVQPGTAARESDPQRQRHAASATQQTTSYFQGHKGGERE